MRKHTQHKGWIKKETKMYLMVLGVLVLVVILGGYFWKESHTKRIYGGTHQTVNQYLTQNNDAFARGEALGNIIGSAGTTSLIRVDAYREALSSAQDDTQEGQILYKMAMSYEQKGDLISSINVLKRVADDTAYPRNIRAYAIQELVNIHYLNPGNTAVITNTFTGDSYAPLYTQNDTALSYRKLCERASASHPLGACESRIANWYAKDAISQLHSTSTTASSTLAEDLSQVRVHVDNANRDINAVKNNQNARVDVPNTILRMATMYGRLAQYGLDTKEHAEGLFQEASQSANSIFGHENPFWYYRYASYLNATYGAKRSADVIFTLAHLYNGGFSTQDQVVFFLSRQRTNTNGHNKAAIVALSKVDPKFKAYLISLGWTKKDF